MKRLNKIVVIFFTSLLTLACCTSVETPSDPGTTILNILSERFANKDYIEDIYIVGNPFEKDGKKAVNIIEQLKKLTSTSKLNYFVGPDSKFGIEDSDVLETATELISKSYSVTKDEIVKLNASLNSTGVSAEGIDQHLNRLVSQGSITWAQSELTKLFLTQIHFARTLTEASKINATFEYEVYNSRLSDKEKSVLLLSTATIKEMILNEMANTGDSSDQSYFKKTSVGVIIFLAVVGAGFGIMAAQEMCDPGATGCYIAYGLVGAVVGSFIGWILISDGGMQV